MNIYFPVKQMYALQGFMAIIAHCPLPIAPLGNGAHAFDERVNLDSVRQATKRLRTTLPIGVA